MNRCVAGATRRPCVGGYTTSGTTAGRCLAGDVVSLVQSGATTDATDTGDARRRRPSFREDFAKFFLRGLAALMPTLITLWILVKVWEFLWDSLGRHIIYLIVWIWNTLVEWGVVEWKAPAQIRWFWYVHMPELVKQAIGVGLAILFVYIIGYFLGNLIGRTTWRLAEMAVMRIPLVRAIYPAVKQITDFFLHRDAKQQFEGSRVVAVHARDPDVWSIGLVTGAGLKPLNDATKGDMVTIFVPSSPTAFSGYVVVAPRDAVIELPMSVEEAMRLLVSGGVLNPEKAPATQSLRERLVESRVADVPGALNAPSLK